MKIPKTYFLAKLFFIVLTFSTFVSCDTNQVTKLNLDKSTIVLNVGQSDTITASISYSGEIMDPITWEVQNSELLSYIENTGGRVSKTTEESSIEKQIVIKGLKPGTTLLTLKVGDKTIDCQITVSQKNYTFNKAFAANWGNLYDFGTNNFEIYLLENSLTVNDTGRILGDGSLLILDFNVPITQNSLLEGNFSMANTGEINTFFPGEFDETQTYVTGTRVVKIGQTNTTTTLVRAGNYSVTFTDAGFKIEGDLILSTDESVHFTYNGPVNVKDNREVPVEIAPLLTKGILYYYGVAYKDAPSNNFVAYLASESVNFSDSIWDGDILMLEINTPLTVTNTIPDGVYNVIPKLTEVSDLAPSSLVLGYQTESGERWGTWFFGESIKKIKTGNIVVSKTGDQYTINYNLLDKIGSKVYGTFTGPLSYVNGTLPASNGISPARVKRYNQTKSFQPIQPNSRNRKHYILYY